jgi:hypothetical protein
MTSSHRRFPNIDNNIEQIMIVRVLAVQSADNELYYSLSALLGTGYASSLICSLVMFVM